MSPRNAALISAFRLSLGSAMAEGSARGAPTLPFRHRRYEASDHWLMSALHRLAVEMHHLEDVAADGYAPSTLAIVLAGILIALLVLVGVALGITLAVYYTS
jgi:hypothetical protein